MNNTFPALTTRTTTITTLLAESFSREQWKKELAGKGFTCMSSVQVKQHTGETLVIETYQRAGDLLDDNMVYIYEDDDVTKDQKVILSAITTNGQQMPYSIRDKALTVHAEQGYVIEFSEVITAAEVTYIKDTLKERFRTEKSSWALPPCEEGIHKDSFFPLKA